MVYTGALSARAHFPRYTSVPGVSGGHVEPIHDPDPFSPAPEPVESTGEDVWQPREVSAQTEMVVEPVHHWAAGLQRPVPSNVEGPDDDVAATARMLATHGVVRYRPDKYPVYKHGGQGRHIAFVEGRRPQEPSMEAFLMGRNAYDATNPPSEVYGGDRYRLGTTIENFGLYEYWTKQGQDGWLRAYTGLHPQMPVDKPRLENTPPQIPNSRGTDHWNLPSWQRISSFALPSETSMTDYEMAAEGDQIGSGFYDDDGRL